MISHAFPLAHYKQPTKRQYIQLFFHMILRRKICLHKSNIWKAQTNQQKKIISSKWCVYNIVDWLAMKTAYIHHIKYERVYRWFLGRVTLVHDSKRNYTISTPEQHQILKKIEPKPPFSISPNLRIWNYSVSNEWHSERISYPSL